MRRIFTTAAVGAALVASLTLAPGSASACGPLGQLGCAVQDTVSGVGDTVSTTLEETGLNEVVDLGISANDQQLLGISANVGNGVATVDANVSTADGVGLDAGATVLGEAVTADASASLLGEGSLAGVSAEATVGGDLLSLGADVTAGGEALLDVGANASVAGGELLELGAGATVGGDSLLAVDLGLGAGGNEIIEGGVELPGGGGETIVPPLPEIPGTQPTTPEQPATQPVAPVAGGESTSITGGTTDVASGGRTASVPALVGGVALAAPQLAPMLPAVAGEPVRTLVPFAGGAAAQAASTAASAGATAASEAVSSAGALVSTVRNELAPKTRTAADILVAAASQSSVSVTNSFASNGLLAVLAAAAALGAALLLLAGRRESFRHPASRICLPPVPPG